MKRIHIIAVLLMLISHINYASNNATLEFENKITEIDSLLTLEYRSNVDIDASNLIKELQDSLNAETDVDSWCTYAQDIICLQSKYIAYKKHQIGENPIYKHLNNTDNTLFSQELPKWESADSSYLRAKYLLVQYVKQIDKSIVNIETQFSYIISDLRIVPPAQIDNDNIIDILQNKLTEEKKQSLIERVSKNEILYDEFNTATDIIMFELPNYNLSSFFSEQQQEYIKTLEERIDIYRQFIS